MGDKKTNSAAERRPDIDLTTGMFERDMTKGLAHTAESFSYRSRRLKKRVLQFFDNRTASDKKSILFIMGCQRSGTTLMTDIFDRDLATRVYGEFSKMSSLDTLDKIRLNPLPLVKAELDKDTVPLVVLKPLVESQHAISVLDYFSNAKTLWMYRDYRAVAISIVSKWGDGNAISNLRSIVKNLRQDWRSENVSDETKKIVKAYFSENMNPYDAAALFWLARNRLFFKMGLDRHPRVAMCKYEELLANPGKMMRAIYRFAGAGYPSDDILVDVHADAARTKKVELSRAVVALCDELLNKLDSVCKARSGVIARFGA